LADGALRRDENNTVSNFDQYPWCFVATRAAERWAGATAACASIRFYQIPSIVPGKNPDDKAAARTMAPRCRCFFGLMFALDPNVHSPYATAGRGFETPTLNEPRLPSERRHRPELDLRAAHSDNFEVGVKASGRKGWRSQRGAVPGPAPPTRS
jgi:iron complex outermembrane receptor protein